MLHLWHCYVYNGNVFLINYYCEVKNEKLD